MAEEIDDFYREDFSTDSEWEVFNAQLSDVFQKWTLSSLDWGAEFDKNELFECDWQVQSETLELLQKEIIIYYYSAKVKSCEIPTPTEEQKPTIPMHKDLASVLNSFGPISPEAGKETLHTLARLYGLRRFVVMHPHQQHLINPSEFTFFQSSVAVVGAEVNSSVPIFVQIHDPKWNFYIGVGFSPYQRTNFDVVALEQCPPSCCYLSGLLSMFKEKHHATYVQPTTVNVRYTYALDTLNLRIPMNIPFATSSAPDNIMGQLGPDVHLSTANFTALPSGYFPDSCTEICLTFTWPAIAENIAIDSPLHSDFVPSKAPFGSVHQQVHSTSYLSSCVRDYYKLYDEKQTLESFVGRNFSGASSGCDIPNPINKLTKSTHLMEFRTQREQRDYMVVTQRKKLPGPMTDNELEQMLIYLFPYMHPEVALFPYGDQSRGCEFDPHRIKSAQADSLVSRLSCLLATCNAHFGGTSGLAQLWAAFTRELRLLWDCCAMVPG